MTYRRKIADFASEGLHALDVDLGFALARQRIRARAQPNALFIHSPKTAGTSIEHAIESIGGVVEGIPSRIPRRFPGRGIACFRHNTLPALIERGALPEDYVRRAFRFTIVRNPFDRFVSLWRHFARGHRWHHDVTIDAFCDLLSASRFAPPSLDYEPGLWFFRPMTDWLDLTSLNLEVDFVGRFEDLSGAVSRIRREIPNFPEPPHLNATQQTLDYRAAITSADTRLFIEQLYESDLERFSYSF